MKGVGAGDSPPLPSFGARNSSLTPPPGAEAQNLHDARAAAAPATAPSNAAPAPSNEEEEDFNYTYMPPARHRYELPTDNPGENKSWQYWMGLSLRAAAALSISFLAYHSDLPYLIGLTRRRRDGSYGG